MKKIAPEKSMILGPVRVIPQEYLHVNCKSIDIDLQTITEDQVIKYAEMILDEYSIKK